MLRITTESFSNALVLQVEGRITTEHIAVLEEEGQIQHREDRHLILDLEKVRFIDQDGLELLRRWVDEGTVLRGGSLFVRTLLAEHGLG